jgi:hypothetical protein
MSSLTATAWMSLGTMSLSACVTALDGVRDAPTRCIKTELEIWSEWDDMMQYLCDRVHLDDFTMIRWMNSILCACEKYEKMMNENKFNVTTHTRGGSAMRRRLAMMKTTTRANATTPDAVPITIVVVLVDELSLSGSDVVSSTAVDGSAANSTEEVSLSETLRGALLVWLKYVLITFTASLCKQEGQIGRS